MYNLIVKKYGEVRFTGLMILKSSGERVHYILLDPTGIKLLESEVTAGSEPFSVKPTGVMASSRMHRFFDTVMRRLYLQVPDRQPCGRNGLMHFCMSADNNSGWLKKCRVWPFVYWRAEKRQKSAGGSSFLMYKQPWLGVDIRLEEMDYGAKK